jgi:hypothetical protein
MRTRGCGRLIYSELSECEIIDASPSTTDHYSFAGVDDVASFLPNPTAKIDIQNYQSDSNKKLVTVTITWKKNTYENKTSTLKMYAVIANVG